MAHGRNTQSKGTVVKGIMTIWKDTARDEHEKASLSGKLFSSAHWISIRRKRMVKKMHISKKKTHIIVILWKIGATHVQWVEDGHGLVLGT
jgi:hypothetical protein